MDSSHFHAKAHCDSWAKARGESSFDFCRFLFAKAISAIPPIWYYSEKMVGFQQERNSCTGRNCIAKRETPPPPSRSYRQNWILLPPPAPFAATTPRCSRLCRHFSPSLSTLSVFRFATTGRFPPSAGIRRAQPPLSSNFNRCTIRDSRIIYASQLFQLQLINAELLYFCVTYECLIRISSKSCSRNTRKERLCWSI